MSTPTCVRVRPYRRIFATRKSMLLRRSAIERARLDQVHRDVAPPERLRPSVAAAAMYALFTTKFAARLVARGCSATSRSPGRRLAESYTSRARGIASGTARRRGSTGSTGEPPAIDVVAAARALALLRHRRPQRAGVREPAPGARAALHREPVPQPRDDVDVHALPVLGLLREVASRCCASSSTCPTLVGTRLYRPPTVWPPPPGSRGSTGAVMLNGV